MAETEQMDAAPVVEQKQVDATGPAPAADLPAPYHHRAKHGPHGDLAEENYKGPGIAASAAGEGFLAHYKWGAIGAVGGTGIAYIFKSAAATMVNAIREHANSIHGNPEGFIGGWKKSVRWASHFLFGTGPRKQAHFHTAIENEIRNGGAHFTEHEMKAFNRWVSARELGFGYSILHHIPYAGEYLEKLLEIKPGISEAEHALAVARASRATTALSVGGIAAAFGFFVMPFIVAHRGFKRGIEGRDQFDRAREEIRTQRAEYDDLRQKYVDTRTELEETKTALTNERTAVAPAVAETPATDATTDAPAETPAEKPAAETLAKTEDAPAGQKDAEALPQEETATAKASPSEKADASRGERRGQLAQP